MCYTVVYRSYLGYHGIQVTLDTVLNHGYRGYHGIQVTLDTVLYLGYCVIL